MFLLILGKEEGRGVEKNIYQLPPIHTSTGDQTHNLLVCRTTLQPMVYLAVATTEYFWDSSLFMQRDSGVGVQISVQPLINCLIMGFV